MSKEKPILQLTYTDPIRWRDVKKELPTKDIRYAEKRGVTVMVFDLYEYVESGSYEPGWVFYDFEKKQFLTLCTRGEWIPLGITHWMPLPPGPVRRDSPTAVSKHGFKYFKGSSKLANEFIKLSKKKIK